MRKKTKKTYGVGINDANYPVTVRSPVTGAVSRCKIFEKWSGMLERCYSERALKRCPSYEKTSVCDEWLSFMSFKSWVDTQDWHGKELDKDLYGDGTLYSPETCCFLPKRVNLMIASGIKSSLLTGVTIDSATGKYIASCHAFKDVGYQKRLGTFDTEQEAHEAWKSEKFKQAVSMARTVDDFNVAVMLIGRYSGLSDAEIELALK